MGPDVEKNCRSEENNGCNPVRIGVEYNKGTDMDERGYYTLIDPIHANKGGKHDEKNDLYPCSDRPAGGVYAVADGRRSPVQRRLGRNDVVPPAGPLVRGRSGD